MKILIQPKCGIPIYLQVAEGIVYNIGWRKLKMGDALPPTRVLAAENGLDHKTVAKGYAELRSQGVAFPHRPTGSYIIMSQAQHLAEVKRDAFIKVMECLLRGIRMLRRMPPELEPGKSIQEYFQKLKDCETQINELNAIISAESAKPAADLPGVFSPLGIDEALARMAAERANPATNAQEAPTQEPSWSNAQNIAPDPPVQPTQGETFQDAAWNNPRFPSSGPELQTSNLKLRTIAQSETPPDTPWNNSQFSTSNFEPKNSNSFPRNSELNSPSPKNPSFPTSYPVSSF